MLDDPRALGRIARAHEEAKRRVEQLYEEPRGLGDSLYMRGGPGPVRAAAITAFMVGLALLLLNPPSLAGLRGLLFWLVGAVFFVLIAAWITALIGDDEMPEAEFRGSPTAARRSPRFRRPSGRQASSTCW